MAQKTDTHHGSVTINQLEGQTANTPILDLAQFILPGLTEVVEILLTPFQPQSNVQRARHKKSNPALTSFLLEMVSLQQARGGGEEGPRSRRLNSRASEAQNPSLLEHHWQQA